MSLSTEDKILTEVVARLALASPTEWKAFVAAFEQYVGGRRDQLVNANREELERAQGRAQNATALLGTFSNAVKDANTIADRKSSALAQKLVLTTQHARGF